MPSKPTIPMQSNSATSRNSFTVFSSPRLFLLPSVVQILSGDHHYHDGLGNIQT